MNHAQKLSSRRRVVAEGAEHAAGLHGHAAFVYPARRHALMLALDHHGHALGLENVADGIGDLYRHFFLDLKALRIDIDQTRQLADADDPVGGQVGDVGDADNRRHVVLAVGAEVDIA